MDDRERNPLGMRAWERLDQILHELGVQAQGRSEILTFTFQSDSLVTATNEALARLLPRFNEVGLCKRVTDQLFYPLSYKIDGRALGMTSAQ